MISDRLASLVVGYFNPSGRCLDPCGDFAHAIVTCVGACTQPQEFLEMERKRDFDWIITAPPIPFFRAYLWQSMELANDIVFVTPMNCLVKSQHLTDIRRFGFGLRNCVFLDESQVYQLAAVHLKRGYVGPLDIDAYTLMGVIDE